MPMSVRMVEDVPQPDPVAPTSLWLTELVPEVQPRLLGKARG